MYNREEIFMWKEVKESNLEGDQCIIHPIRSLGMPSLPSAEKRVDLTYPFTRYSHRSTEMENRHVSWSNKSSLFVRLVNGAGNGSILR